MAEKICPKCKSNNITFQREQSGSVGASQNRVVIDTPKKSHGCLYWLCCGWILSIFYWLFIGWWKALLFGHRKSGWNLKANKSINRTVAVCQNCGHTWKV